MVELKVVCDRCHAVVVVGRACLDVRAGSLRRKFATIDLCETCANALQAWLGDRPAPGIAREGPGSPAPASPHPEWGVPAPPTPERTRGT